MFMFITSFKSCGWLHGERVRKIHFNETVNPWPHKHNTKFTESSNILLPPFFSPVTSSKSTTLSATFAPTPISTTWWLRTQWQQLKEWTLGIINLCLPLFLKCSSSEGLVLLSPLSLALWGAADILLNFVFELWKPKSIVGTLISLFSTWCPCPQCPPLCLFCFGIYFIVFNGLCPKVHISTSSKLLGGTHSFLLTVALPPSHLRSSPPPNGGGSRVQSRPVSPTLFLWGSSLTSNTF